MYTLTDVLTIMKCTYKLAPNESSLFPLSPSIFKIASVLMGPLSRLEYVLFGVNVLKTTIQCYVLQPHYNNKTYMVYTVS